MCVYTRFYMCMHVLYYNPNFKDSFQLYFWVKMKNNNLDKKLILYVMFSTTFRSPVHKTVHVVKETNVN